MARPVKFAWDVFVSYRHASPDREWVRAQLVPKLKAFDLRVCIDHESFRLGAPVLTEIERAIENSRYTLAVLSPAYLAGTYAELESILARHLGIERAERRFIAIMREPCTPPLDLRQRIWLDMTEGTDVEQGFADLATQLKARDVGDE